MRAATPFLLVHDPVVMEEFLNLPISKFDRVREYPGEGAMAIFVDLQTKDPNYYERKMPFLKALGINFSTKHTPLVLSQCQKHFSKLYKG